MHDISTPRFFKNWRQHIRYTNRNGKSNSGSFFQSLIIRRSDHKKKLDLKCNDCGKTFTQQEMFRRHTCHRIPKDANYIPYQFKNVNSSVVSACSLIPKYEEFKLLQDQRCVVPGVYLVKKSLDLYGTIVLNFRNSLL